MTNPDYRSAQIEAILALKKSFDAPEHSTTLVSPVEDYAVDRRMCLTAVAFVGETELSAQLQRLSAELRQIEPWQHFYPQDSQHLTVQNVRTISDPPNFDENVIEKTITVFKKIIPKYRRFHFECAEILQMPSSAAVLAYAEAEFLTLTKELKAGLAGAGIPDDKVYISDDVVFGNVTFCRYTKAPGKKFLDVLDASTLAINSDFYITDVELISTNSICDRKVTKTLATFRLHA